MPRLIDADALELSIRKTGQCEHCKNQYLHRVSLSKWDMHCKVIAQAPTIDAEPVITGDTSDGYHTFNELYHHREVLFSVIVKAFSEKAWKSRKHHDGTMYDDMFIVGIETPEGQVTYHYDIDPYWKMFQCKEVEFAPEWDGHTPEQAIERIRKLEPVRHGRWIRNDLGETYCSECNNRIPFVECFDFYPDCCMDDDDMQWNEEIDKTNYCPNCGAKMDAEDINVPTNEPNKICPINGAPCNECVPGAYCAKMDGKEHECD